MLKTRHQRIAISLVLALLVHALLLLVLTDNKQQLLVIRFAEKPPSISVTLEAINIAAATNPVQPQPGKKMIQPGPAVRKKREENKNIAQPGKMSPLPDVESLANNQQTGLSHETTRPEASHPPQNTPALNRAKILSRLRKDLEQHFYYPGIARRKGIQGTVLLGFGINQTGLIHDIRIIKSSGHSILDLAAEDSIQQLHRVHWRENMLAKSDIDLELPIIYKLME